MNAEIKTRIEMINRGEVPEGYKETKVGIIPEDWEVIRLEENCKKINVGFVGTCEKYYTNRQEGIPMLRTGNIKNGKIKFEDLKYVTKEFHEKNVKSQINRGDILIARHGSNGEGALYDYDNDANSLNIVIVRSDKDAINTNYLYYQINSSNTKRQVLARTAGSTQGVINTKEIKKIRIIKANLKEQQKIAQILSTWDEAIELKERLIKEKKEQKKGLMQKLLTGEVRLPGFDGEWEEVRLGEVVDRVAEKNNGKSNNVLTISAEDGLISQELYFNKQIASKNLDNYIYLVNGDFAYNKSYSSGYPMGAIKMLEKYGEGIVSSLYICFRPREKVSRSYLKQYFDGNVFNHEIFKIAQEGARNHGLLNIGIGDFFNIKLNLPPLQEQKAIAQILTTADKEINLLTQELEQLKFQKKGLMQLLLTGIVRVKP